MLENDAIDQLEAALGALGHGDDMPWTAIAPLSQLSATGLDLNIDYSAKARLGVPVIVAYPKLPSADLAGLTNRQREVAQLMASGLSNKEIARKLGIAVATVKDHVHAVLTGLDLTSRGQLIARYHGTKE